VIAYYAKRIAQDLKLPSQFAALAPKVREFLETRAFGERVNLDDPAMIKAISSNVAQYVTLKTFAQALRAKVVEELQPALVNAGRRLSETPPFPWSRGTMPAAKTVFTLAVYENDFERKFARFLEGAPDVQAFAKLPAQFGFIIQYTDSAANLRNYEPDFVAATEDAGFYLIETKGREDIDVAHKDRAARLWCENATLLTGNAWTYLKVPQKEFEALQPSELADLAVLAG
jgi:type III restriction enzyme